MPKITKKENEKDNKILKLEKEIEKLKKNIKKQKYGLVWMDVPEAFEDDVENKLPVLKEVSTKAIKSKDNKPTNILIEGDNYHALTCLNYTHKEKIDVIYIDPPYNTGSDGFKYKDKRILKKFPDGTEVPKDHPFRHSYWLSFMRKRLELAKDLLKDTGVIFISIDDNELSQLKLLCDEIFGESNFIANFIWESKLTGGHDSKHINIIHEYVLCYAKNSSEEDILNKKISDSNYSVFDNKKQLFFKWDSLWTVSHGYTKNCDYPITAPNGNLVYPWMCHKDGEKVKGIARWFWSKEKYIKEKNLLSVKKDKNGEWKVYKKVYSGTKIPYKSVFDKLLVGGTSHGKEDLKKIFSEINIFNNPKSLLLIREILKIGGNKNLIALDFFAGSGTTGQAVLELNDEDKGERQFILVTNNDEITNGKSHKIMSDICYPRIKKIIKGYNKKKGLGGSVKYYKTAFVGENSILNTTDKDKTKLAHNAGELLAIAENTLDLIKENNFYQIFENKNQHTAVYFKEELDKLNNFVKEVNNLKKPVSVYIFSWEDDEFIENFGDNKNIQVKTIPRPILEIYKQIYNLI